MSRRRRILAVLAGAAWLLPLLGTAHAATPSPSDVEEGRTLFENSCSSCHGVDGKGTNLGPSVVGSGAAGAHFMLSTGRMPLDDPNHQPIRKPAAFDPDQIAQISAYVASLGPGPDIPEVDLGRGDLVEGQQLYSENCAACHSSAGAGGAVGAGLEAPQLHKATPVELVEAMRIGPGTMPVFEERTISEEEADSIARYLVYLRGSGDPGGLSMGRIGPIAEGFVVWLVGVGFLILVCRRIGEKE
ncbi:MAG TPA: c-type cytochrome [Actinomycetota bacterium]|nr:c-type cytochrome [Actinomycetota bacterium]